MKLAIISHTEHYFDKNGAVVGWGPTVREINHLATHFEKIYHVACLYKRTAPPGSLGYTGNNIEFVPIPPSGGNTIWTKLTVLRTMPAVIRTVNSIISNVDYIQLRLPTGMGNYLLPWLLLKKPKARIWVKYAGNWIQDNPPLGYAFQRWFLKKNFLNCKVTVNGRWPGQPEHILSFENPCLTEEERKQGTATLANNTYNEKLNFIFVGRMEEAKGVGRILDAFKELKNEKRIGKIRIVGDGPARRIYEQRAKEYRLDVQFLGFMSRTDLNELFMDSHILLLPSTASEGLPKVIAEGANYGCIPVVSDISCMSQYIHDNRNGFIIPSPDAESLLKCIRKIISMPHAGLEPIARNACEMGKRFTYEYYSKRIMNEIL